MRLFLCQKNCYYLTMTEQIKIDFIGVGVEKAGTTWLGKCLEEHPEVCFSSQKEICFFNKHYDEGLGFYRQFFTHCQGEKIRGYFTPGYFNDPMAPQLIKKHFPEAKLIFCFRQPSERSYSHYRDNISHGKISVGTSFEQAMKDDKRIIDYSLYSEMLNNYYDLFPAENILVILQDDISQKPEEVLTETFKFLGIDTEFIPPSTKQRVHAGASKRYHSFVIARNIRWIMAQGVKVKDSWLGKAAIKILTIVGFKKALQKVFRANQYKDATEVSKDIISQESKTKLNQYFKEDINKLSKLINKDLTNWLYN